MKKLIFSIFLIFQVLGLLTALQPRLEPMELYTDPKWQDPEIAEEDLIELSFLASGLDVPTAKRLTEELVAIIDEMESSTVDPNPEDILVWIHNNMLNRYEFHQTKIDVLLEDGIHNCVSSAVVYMIFCRRFGWPVKGVRSDDHAFCSVYVNQEWIDVETTLAIGYNPGEKKEVQDEFSETTGYQYVPPGDYQQRRDLNIIDMIGLIFQNRAAAMQINNNFYDSVEVLVDRLAVCRSVAARNDLLLAIGGWAAELNSSGRFKEGYNFVADAAIMYAFEESLAGYLDKLAYNTVVDYIQNKKWSEITDFINSEKMRLITLARREELSAIAIEEKIEEDGLNFGYHEAIAAVRVGWDSAGISEERAKELLDYRHSLYLNDMANQGQFKEAVIYIDTLPARERSSYVQTVRDQCLYNWVVTVHNTIIDLSEQERYDEAVTLLQDVLAYDPNNEILLRDWSILEQRINR